MAKERHWKWICQEARGQVISHEPSIHWYCIGVICKELEKQFVSMKKTISTTMKRSGELVIMLRVVL